VASSVRVPLLHHPRGFYPVGACRRRVDPDAVERLSDADHWGAHRPGWATRSWPSSRMPTGGPSTIGTETALAID